MKEQLEHKLKELEDSDVIEKVQGPTPWVSPLVVVPKANSDIRICDDPMISSVVELRIQFTDPMCNKPNSVADLRPNNGFPLPAIT
jgi:hypothetical protein